MGGVPSRLRNQTSLRNPFSHSLLYSTLRILSYPIPYQTPLSMQRIIIISYRVEVAVRGSSRRTTLGVETTAKVAATTTSLVLVRVPVLVPVPL